MNRPLLLGMDCEAAQLPLLASIRLLAPHHVVSLSLLEFVCHKTHSKVVVKVLLHLYSQKIDKSKGKVKQK